MAGYDGFSKSNRNQTLDVLRGIAILLVLGFHYSYFPWWHQIGWAGVDLFFVLSGFLISGLLFSEIKRSGSIDLKKFLVRRGFKIYPPFYLLIAITGLSVIAGQNSIRSFLPEVFFVQNYFPHIWGHTWSLAVEEHFYIFLPLLLIALLRIGGGIEKLPWVLGGIMVGCLALRSVAVIEGVRRSAILLQTQYRMDSLCGGVLLGYWRHFRPEFFRWLQSKQLLPAGMVLVFPVVFLKQESALMASLGLTLLCLGFCCLLVWSIDRASSRRLDRIALAWIGKRSYSIYLWHMPIGVALYRGQIDFRFFLEGVVGSILFGAIFSEAVEKPSLAVRDKLFPSYGVSGKAARTEAGMRATTV